MSSAQGAGIAQGAGGPRSARVADLLARLRWDATPLGPREGWDPVVVGVVDLMLASSVAMALCYGEDQVLLYNDPYAALLGAHHPAAFVRPAVEVFADVWGSTTTAKAVGEVFRTGVPFVEIDRPPVVDDGDPDTGVFLTHSYSVVRDSTGRVFGVLAIVIASMQTTATTRQLHDLRELTAALARTVTLDDVARVTMHHAMATFDVDHVAMVLDDGRGWRAVRRTRSDALDDVNERLPPLWHRFPPDAPLPMIQAASPAPPCSWTPPGWRRSMPMPPTPRTARCRPWPRCRCPEGGSAAPSRSVTCARTSGCRNSGRCWARRQS